MMGGMFDEPDDDAFVNHYNNLSDDDEEKVEETFLEDPRRPRFDSQNSADDFVGRYVRVRLDDGEEYGAFVKSFDANETYTVAWEDGSGLKMSTPPEAIDWDASQPDPEMTALAKAAAESKEDDEDDDELWLAARRGSLRSVRWLIEDEGVPYDEEGGGRTPFYWAVHAGHYDVVEYLMDLGAEDRDGTAYIAAQDPLVKELLEKRGFDKSKLDDAVVEEDNRRRSTLQSMGIQGGMVDAHEDTPGYARQKFDDDGDEFKYAEFDEDADELPFMDERKSEGSDPPLRAGAFAAFGGVESEESEESEEEPEPSRRFGAEWGSDPGVDDDDKRSEVSSKRSEASSYKGYNDDEPAYGAVQPSDDEDEASEPPYRHQDEGEDPSDDDSEPPQRAQPRPDAVLPAAIAALREQEASPMRKETDDTMTFERTAPTDDRYARIRDTDVGYYEPESPATPAKYDARDYEEQYDNAPLAYDDEPAPRRSSLRSLDRGADTRPVYDTYDRVGVRATEEPPRRRSRASSAASGFMRRFSRGSRRSAEESYRNSHPDDVHRKDNYGNGRAHRKRSPRRRDSRDSRDRFDRRESRYSRRRYSRDSYDRRRGSRHRRRSSFDDDRRRRGTTASRYRPEDDNRYAGKGGECLLEPRGQLVHLQHDDCAEFEVTNTTDRFVTVKVMSNKSQHFVVRPSRCVLAPNTAVRVGVYSTRYADEVEGSEFAKFLFVFADISARAYDAVVDRRNDPKEELNTLWNSHPALEPDYQFTAEVEVVGTARRPTERLTGHRAGYNNSTPRSQRNVSYEDEGTPATRSVTYSQAEPRRNPHRSAKQRPPAGSQRIQPPPGSRREIRVNSNGSEESTLWTKMHALSCLFSNLATGKRIKNGSVDGDRRSRRDTYKSTRSYATTHSRYGRGGGGRRNDDYYDDDEPPLR